MKLLITYLMFFFPVLFAKPEASKPVIENSVKQVEIKLDKLNHDIWKLNEMLKNESL